MSDLLPVERARQIQEGSKVSASTVAELVMEYLGDLPKGHDVDLTDMARDPRFRGVHFNRLLRAVESLAKKTTAVNFDGVRVTKMASRMRSTWKESAEPAPRENFGGIVTLMRTASRQGITKESASGLYGYTKGTQRDVEATIRKAQKEALKIAQSIQKGDPRVARFLQVHANRTKSQAAKILLAAIDNVQSMKAKNANLEDACWEGYEAVGTKVKDGETVPNCVPKTASVESYSLYGFPDKVADTGLAACTRVRVAMGRITFDLHHRRQARHEDITGFLTSHAKKARCAYSRFLLASYPDHEQFKVAQEEQAQNRVASAPTTVDEWLAWEE